MPRRVRTPASTRGRLLAVCGLCGGAGASTLAYLVALAAARSDPGSVLVGDTGGPTGGISYYAGVEAPRSLTELAEQIASGLPTGQLLATTSEGLRVLASGPRFTAECPRDGDRAAARSSPGALRALRHRLRHAGPRVRPGRFGERLARGVGAAGERQRGTPSPPRARRHHPHPARPRGDRRPPRREPPARLRSRSSSTSPRVAARRWCSSPGVPDLATGDIAAALDAAQVSLQAIQGATGAMNPSGAGHTRAGPATTRRPPASRSAPAGSVLPERYGLARLTATVGATTIAGSMLVAGAVRVAMAAPVRERLGYTFRGVPARPDVAIGIFAHNLRAILGVFGLLLVAQIASRATGGAGRAQRVTIMVGEVILAGVSPAKRAGRRSRARRLRPADGPGDAAPRADRARRLLARARSLPRRAGDEPCPALTWPRSPRSAWRCSPSRPPSRRS